MRLGVTILVAAILVSAVNCFSSDALRKLLDLVEKKRGDKKCGINKYNNVPQQPSPLTRAVRKLLDEDEYQAVKRILGGSEARKSEIPWIVYLSIEVSAIAMSRCGGSLITDQYIVTAAHCFYGDENEGYPLIDKSKIQVFLGEHNTAENVKEPSEKKFTPEQVIIHPKYDIKDATNQNDIALIKLPKKVSFNDDMRTPCLPKNNLAPSTYCVAAGWGLTGSGQVSDILKVVNLTSISNSNCENKRGHTIYPGTLCAEAPPGVLEGDACQGDSGGPLSCLINGRFFLSGVTSYGVKCGDDTAPGVYSDTKYFLPWILGIVGKSNVCFCDEGKPGGGTNQPGGGGSRPGGGGSQPGGGGSQPGGGGSRPGGGGGRPGGRPGQGGGDWDDGNWEDGNWDDGNNSDDHGDFGNFDDFDRNDQDFDQDFDHGFGQGFHDDFFKKLLKKLLKL